MNFEVRDGQPLETLRANRTNDISASSQLGGSGVLTLAGLNVDPSRGTEQLPVALASNTQIANSCEAPAIAASSFVVTGRSGLPLSPSEPQTQTAAEVGWVALPQVLAGDKVVAGDKVTIAAPSSPGPFPAEAIAIASPSFPPIEASGWHQDAAGKTKLIAAFAAPPGRSHSVTCMTGVGAD